MFANISEYENKIIKDLSIKEFQNFNSLGCLGRDISN